MSGRQVRLTLITTLALVTGVAGAATCLANRDHGAATRESERPITTATPGSPSTASVGAIPSRIATSVVRPVDATATAESTPEATPSVRAGRPMIVVVDGAAILLAPVQGAPEAEEVARDSRITVERDVLGEAIDDDHRWYFVLEPARGFIHSSAVEDAP